MRVFTFLIAIHLCSCSQKIPKAIDGQASSSANKVEKVATRYAVSLSSPPIVHANAEAMFGNPEQWPGIIILSKSGEILEDDNNRVRLSGNGATRLGLGPSYLFTLLKNPRKNMISKGSIKIAYDDQKLRIDASYDQPEEVVDSLAINYGTELIYCKLSVAHGLDCQVKNTNSDGVEFPHRVSWHEPNDPIIEVNKTSYPGLYAMAKSGKLLHIRRFKQTIEPTEVMHPGFKFLRNKNGRYFINANSNTACLQSEELGIFCDVDNVPGLEELQVRPNFRADEIAFSSRHTCILSELGEVWCVGDNSCGQITGRHDGIQHTKDLTKADFLAGTAKQLFAYPGGTCALLIDGRLQCFGLGASVLRKRLRPDKDYRRSYSWVHGFRPENICLGGAEHGV